MSNPLKDIKDGVTHLFYPRLCEGCNKPLLTEEEILCLTCALYNIPRTAYHHIQENETFMRFAGRVKIEKATSLAYFLEDGLLQHLLHLLKYKDRKDVGEYLGKQLGGDLKQLDWHKDIDAIVPVPLHPDKQRVRGFNQAEVIADAMAAVLDINVDSDILKRVKNTDSQTQKNREERILNMQDAFDVNEKEIVAGKHYLLIDDVLTTGATLEACVIALQTIPEVKVSIATIGIAN